jgi:hypothetical protein
VEKSGFSSTPHSFTNFMTCAIEGTWLVGAAVDDASTKEVILSIPRSIF